MKPTLTAFACALALLGGSAIAQQANNSNGPSLTDKAKEAAQNLGEKAKEAVAKVKDKAQETLGDAKDEKDPQQ